MSSGIFKKNRIFAARGIAVCAVCAVCVVLSGSALGQTAQRSVVATGEVTANDVYVRSGPSLNHYTICKLSAGDRVRIVGDRGDFYEVLPPAGTFSLISSEYVDTVDKKQGVVNGNNVRVRAGSKLNNSKYTVQAMLSKGAELTILGENPDGFLRIQPPPGATMWISRKFVEPVPDARLALEVGSAPVDQASAAPAERPTKRLGVTQDVVNDAGESSTNETVTSEPSASEAAGETPANSGGRSSTPTMKRRNSSDIGSRAQLNRLDSDLGAVMAKPVNDRDFTLLVEGFGRIVEQTDDDVARQYAAHRLEQIETMRAMATTLRDLRKMDERATSMRGHHLAERTKMPIVMPISLPDFDVTGELRVSSMYNGGAAPRRYRIVDAMAGGRTKAYVEIPADSDIIVESFIGRFVGIRASNTRLLPGALQPIPVYTVADIVVIERPAAAQKVTRK